MFEGMFFLPESPRYLVRAGKHEMGAAVLRRSEGNDVAEAVIQSELDSIKESLSASHGGSYKELFTGKLLGALVVGAGLQVWRLLS